MSDLLEPLADEDALAEPFHPTHVLFPCMAPACTLYYDVEEAKRRMRLGLPPYTTSVIRDANCPACFERWGGPDGLRAEYRRQQGHQAVDER